MLLFKELSTYYNDWKTGRLEALVNMLMMPSLIINCSMEYEAGTFFEAHHSWHGMNGELSVRPGFRSLELVYELLDHAFPWWTGAMNDPKSRFPETYKLFEMFRDEAHAIDDESERERLLGIIEMKEEQLRAGIKAGRDEMAKMQDDMFLPPMVFTLITHPKYGAGALRAILQTCQNGGLDLDQVYDEDNENSHLIDERLSWSFLEPGNRSEFEQSVYENLKGKEEDCIHFLR